METTAQLIAAFDSQNGSHNDGFRVRSSHQSSLLAFSMERALIFAGIAIAAGVIGSLFIAF